MSNKVQIAFYKGKGNFFNKLIRWWTKSSYSHVEIVIDNTWYTSATWESGTVARKLVPNPKKWDVVTISCGDTAISALKSSAEAKLGKRYDYYGIMFSQVLPWKGDKADRWFCSEFVYDTLITAGVLPAEYKPEEVSPGKLYKILEDKGLA